MQDYFQTDTAVEKYQRGCESMLQITETVPRSTKLSCASVQKAHLKDRN